jgi:transposase
VDTGELNRRRKIAVNLRLKGATFAEAARRAGLSPPTVIAACKAYESGGLRAVDVRRGGKEAGSGARLDAEQQLEIQLILHETLPIDHALGGHLWSGPIVRELIVQRLHLALSQRTVARYLARWGIAAESSEPKLEDDLEATGWTLEDFRWADNRARQSGALLRWAEYRELPVLRAWAQAEVDDSDGSLAEEDDPRYIACLATLNGTIQWRPIERPWRAESLGRFLEIAQQDIGRRLVVVASGWPFDATRKLELWNRRHEDSVEVVDGHPRSLYRRFASHER